MLFNYLLETRSCRLAIDYFASTSDKKKSCLISPITFRGQDNRQQEQPSQQASREIEVAKLTTGTRIKVVRRLKLSIPLVILAALSLLDQQDALNTRIKRGVGVVEGRLQRIFQLLNVREYSTSSSFQNVFVAQAWIPSSTTAARTRIVSRRREWQPLHGIRHELCQRKLAAVKMRKKSITSTVLGSHGNEDHYDNDLTRGKTIDGKAVALTVREEIKDRVSHLSKNNNGKVPGLAVILVGQRPDSVAYVNMKKKACQDAGMYSIGFEFNETVSTIELIETIHRLNHDDTIHGILIQLPLPSHIAQDGVLNSVHPDKDVDGLHPINIAALQLYNAKNGYRDAPFNIPCTPLGCLELLDRYNITIEGKNVVVIGRSILVGLPMIRLLIGRDATVSAVHSRTIDPESIVSQADIVIAAVGRPKLITSEWIKNGAVIIDVGINSVKNEQQQQDTSSKKKKFKLVGDVDYDNVAKKVAYITPVPGGVGPMTIAMLLNNTLKTFERSQQQRPQ